ncbi:TetR/AcrR family transcriptional regulator [Cryptosporangium arvum]|uniref:Transcriptional regulator n=1 Tax=Cryptosporangium arvum DSM 44712 TaxID=927661 RepID=A0A010Z2E5_9ACTN|nr:TetR/AcrR family transcriptional regulator [Cryptosporangium arvum]EXG81598.1 transcriptional regulator [Cryptosporangium arvum DSM 44712]
MDAAERLVASTQELLWERGYVGTSPKAIQQRAGAGQGSMYHHFTGKPDLARAAIDRSATELRGLAEETFAGPGSAYDRIAAYLRRDRDVLRGCRVGRLTQDPDVVANPQLREPLEETLGWLRHRISGLIREGIASGEISSELDPDDVAAALVAVVQGGYVLARSADDPELFTRAAEGALALLGGRR